MSIARTAVNNPVAANLLMWAIILGGLFAASGLVREFFPNSSPDQIFITVPYPGGTPEEIERSVARRIERGIRGVESIDEVSSTVYEGLSVTTVTLDDGADHDLVLNDLRSEVDNVRAELPDAAEDPEITLVQPFVPVISVVVRGRAPERRLHLVATTVRDELQNLPGISRVLVSGLRPREIWAEVKPEKLEEYGLTFAEVGAAVAAGNLDLPSGRLRAKFGNINVRTMGERSTGLELEEVIVKGSERGAAVRLRDVAEVRETFEDRIESGRFAQEPAVQITVFKAPDQDAVAISESVKTYVRENKNRFGGSLTLDTLTDLAKFIEQRIDLMTRNGKAGLLCVLAVLAFFLNLRVAFWVAVGLPVSFLGTFIVMSLLGATINLISLFGLIIVLGLIVDDAIIIAERVFFHVRAGMPLREAAIVGTQEVMLPVIAAVLTTILAFGPLAFIEGRIGVFLGVLPVVVVAALLVSLVEGLFILPAHLGHGRDWRWGWYIPVVTPVTRAIIAFRYGLMERWLPRGFQWLVEIVTRWRYVALSGAVSLLMVAAGLVAGGIVPFELLQSADAESISVDLEMVAGSSEKKTLEVIQYIEKTVARQAEVEKVFSVIGTSFSERGREVAADPATVGQVNIELVSAEERQDRGLRTSQVLVNDVRRELLGLPGVRRLSVLARAGGPSGSDIEIRLTGEDLDQLARARDAVRDELDRYPGIVEPRDDLQRGKLEARLSLRPVVEPLGLKTRDLALELRNGLFGYEVQDLQGELEEVKVRVLLPEDARDTLEDLGRLRITTPSRRRVPLDEVAEITTERGFATLSRVDGRRAVTVKAEVDKTRANANRITAELTERFSDLSKRFPGVSVSFEGEKKETQESLGSLKVGFPLALFMIYAIVAMLFRSYLQPLVVMTAIPFSLAGAVFGHLVMGFPITVLSLIGVVALAGIVVNDSLILVDFINRRRREGESATRAAIEGSRDRLRAILLTSVTTIAGLFPLMLERSFQAQFLIPMAVSIVFGLALATVLTPLLLPCFYLIFEDLGRGIRWVFLGPRRAGS